MKKDPKQLQIGEVFRLELDNPKGHLVLRVYDIEEDAKIPWCTVMQHSYDEPAEDEYEEEDRYKTGDDMPYVYDSEVEIVSHDSIISDLSQDM
jgi:hypothetical protein